MRSKTSLTLLLCGALLACRPDAPGTESHDADLRGSWRAVLASPGGELPFTLRIEENNGELVAVAVTGAEEAPFSAVMVEGRNVRLELDWYDSEITAEVTEDGSAMHGRWRKTVPSGDSALAFEATRGDGRRFAPLPASAGSETAPATIGGHWAVEFTDEDGSEPARAEFEQKGPRVRGTFLTPTGDYRFLEGTYEHGLLRLSTFDGGHAFLFHATAQSDGTLVGDFWSRDSYHATWTAERVSDGAKVLPDAWSLVGLTNDTGSFSFSFADLDGTAISLDHPRFDGKVVLVNIFGSWCPNCNDKAPLLSDWYDRYRESGLEIVGLAYEFTGDVERDRRQVRRYAERHRAEYPLLLAGLSDKKKAAESLPDLTAVVAFPTTVFIGRDGRVRNIHTGFSGPGTGAHYGELVVELEALIEELLAEQA